MHASPINSGAVVTIQELNPSSLNIRPGASLRVTGNVLNIEVQMAAEAPPCLCISCLCMRLRQYTLETAAAVIVDGDSGLKVDTQHLKLNFRVGSIYEFIGELHIEPNNEVILKARVGRNVDGIDMDLYHQSLKLLREFQSSQNW